ncbi:hypothetical protein Ancab_000053 [Ancistrocladus abbreviatus]
MNDQSQLMSQHQVMSHSQLMNQPQMINSQLQMLKQLNQSQMVNQSQMMNQSQMVSQAQMVAQLPPPPQMVNQSKMMSQSYGHWLQSSSNMPPMNTLKFPIPMKQMYGGGSKPGRSNWKGKKVMENRKDLRRKDVVMPGNGMAGGAVGGGGGGGGYKSPTISELEHQNRLKARRFYPKKKYNRMAPYAHAPRNTTSYIIRAKKSGGIASLVSPYPVTPAVLPTPVLSPSREALVEMAKEEWGVDGYGSMKGLIRLRSSPGHEAGHEAEVDDYEEEEEGGSSESDVEEHVEVERRLDHDLSRFEMIYPNCGAEYNNLLGNRVDDQDTHIAQLEEENLILKERLYLMERQLEDMRRRLQCLERQNQVVEDINEEVVENMSENESEGLRDVQFLGHKELDFVPTEEEAGHYGFQKQNDEEVMRNAPAGSVTKEFLVDKTLENNRTTVSGEEVKEDVVVVNDGFELDVKLDNKDEKYENRRAGEMSMEESGQEQSKSGGKANKDSSLDNERMVVEAQLENNVGVSKDELAGDLRMEEAVPKKMTENVRSEG